MKKNLLDLLKKVPDHPAFGYLNKITDSLIASKSVVDLKKDMSIAFNSTQPLPHRVVAFTRGSCCTVSLVTSYFAQRIPDPVIKARFRLCCNLAAAAYSFTGGDVKLALGFTAMANSTSLPFPFLDQSPSSPRIPKPK